VEPPAQVLPVIWHCAEFIVFWQKDWILTQALQAQTTVFFTAVLATYHMIRFWHKNAGKKEIF
jgi:hypothetical protein